MSNTGKNALEQMRADVYAELFEMLRLPYSEAESVNDRAKRTTEHVLKHCRVEIMMRLIDSYTMAYEMPKRYIHDHKHVEVMPGQMRVIDCGDMPIHKAIPLAPLSDVVSVWKIELENSLAHNKALSTELHDLKHAIREVLCQIEGNKCDLSQGAGSHEALHNAGVQRDMDIIIKCCGEFL